MAEITDKLLGSQGIKDLVEAIKAKSDATYAVPDDIKITSITVNGKAVSIQDKSVALTVPTEDAISQQIATAVGGIKEFNIVVLDAGADLPEVGNYNTIYLKPNDSANSKNIYDEYLYIKKSETESSWELISQKDIDLSSITTDITNLKKTQGELQTAVAGKVASTDFESYKSEVTTALGGKVSTADFESFKEAKYTAPEIQSLVNEAWK